MRWVNTDLNSPWAPVDPPESKAERKLRNDYPEQYQRVPNHIAERLDRAWKEVYAASNEASIYIMRRTNARCRCSNR